MIYLETTKNLSGISIWGTTSDLQFIRNFMGELLENTSFFKHQKLIDVLYSIPYEIRKSYEGNRHIAKHKDIQDNEYSLYGSECMLPLLLIQISMIRNSMAFNENNKLELSFMYALEFQMEKEISKHFPEDSVEIINTLKIIASLEQDIIYEKLPSRCNYFITLKTVKEKKKLLLPILKSFLPHYRNSKLDFKNNEYPDNFEW